MGIAAMRRAVFLVVHLLVVHLCINSPVDLGAVRPMSDKFRLKMAEDKARDDAQAGKQDLKVYQNMASAARNQVTTLDAKLDRTAEDAKAAEIVSAKHHADEQEVENAKLGVEIANLETTSKLFQHAEAHKDMRHASNVLRDAQHAAEKSQQAYTKQSHVVKSDKRKVHAAELAYQHDAIKLNEERNTERRAANLEAEADLNVAKDVQKMKLKKDSKGKDTADTSERFALRGIEEKYRDGEHRLDQHASRVDKLKTNAETIMTKLQEDRESIKVANAQLIKSRMENSVGTFDEQKASILRNEANLLDREADKAKADAIRLSSMAQSNKRDAKRDFGREKHHFHALAANMAEEKHEEQLAEEDLRTINTEAAHHNLQIKSPST